MEQIRKVYRRMVGTLLVVNDLSDPRDKRCNESDMENITEQLLVAWIVLMSRKRWVRE